MRLPRSCGSRLQPPIPICAPDARQRCGAGWIAATGQHQPRRCDFHNPDATDADYQALGRTQIGIVVSGATQFLVQETGVPAAGTSTLVEGDTLQRVVSGAAYDVDEAQITRSGNLATLTFDTVAGNQPKAAWFDGMSHVLLDISDGAGGRLRLPLMLVLPDDLESTSISVVLPADLLTHSWGGTVVVHALAPLASLVDAPEVRSYDEVGFVYKVKLATADSDFTEVAKADDLEQASLTFGAGQVSARVIDVETAADGDVLTLVLDSADTDIQALLGAGDPAAVQTPLNGMTVVKGTAPVFDASAIRPTLDAALSVDMTARADLVGLDLGRLTSTVELPDFAQLALEGANGIDDLFALLKGPQMPNCPASLPMMPNLISQHSSMRRRPPFRNWTGSTP